METCKLDEKESISALEKNVIKRKIEENCQVEKGESKMDVCVKMEMVKDLLNRNFGLNEHEWFDCF